MAISRADVLEYLASANMMEIGELVKEIKSKFGVEIAAPVAVAAAPGGAPGAGAAAAAEEKTEFTVKLTNAGDKKIQVIKVLREITNLGLKEAKDAVDATPAVVKEGVSKDEAEKIKAKFAEVGATVEVA
ncbi:50S ribosomal protein L7/L12 [bacterium]|nr:50S ribosomal protein L7/L12 [bacterium]HMV26743.1 50S ribosomal protein L7/L12 [bacterium]HMW34331.1 50S ribosomal protein L7/L12 [bacterium]HMW36545.1 50S ribosomal protein L7/L12 [bacterium]HMY37489.1 50S ribosomal protein L7/L12 [bacterium]